MRSYIVLTGKGTKDDYLEELDLFETEVDELLMSNDRAMLQGGITFATLGDTIYFAQAVIIRPVLSFAGTDGQITEGHIDADTSEPCPPQE